MNHPPQNLKLAQIVINDLQARAGTDEKTIEEYAEAWREGEKFPAIIVFHDGKHYFLADGFHRFFGAKRADLLDIPCDVRQGGRKEALWFAVGANRAHGLKRTNADKRHAVELALKERPELSNRAIADHVGVHHDLVSASRSQVADSATSNSESLAKPQKLPPPPPERRVGLDGKNYPVPPPKPKIPPPPPPAAKAVPLPPPPEKKAEPEKVLDKTGWPIPAGLLPLWDRRDEIQVLMSAVSKVRCALEKAQESKDLLFKGVGFNSAIIDMGRAYNELTSAQLYAVCTTCQGHLGDACTFCKGRGFLSELQWKQSVTEEAKAIREKAKHAH